MAQAIRPVTMPKWGIEMTEGTINQWSIREGQQVQKGEPLLEVETEKIVNTVESPSAGTLRRIVAAAGDVKPVGSLIAVLADTSVSDAEITSFVESFKGASVSFELDTPAAGARMSFGSDAPQSFAPDAPATGANGEAVEAGVVDTGGGGVASQSSGAGVVPSDLRISPIARRLAETLGIDISRLKGTGRNGRISKEDVESYAVHVKGAAATRGDGPAPAPAPIPAPNRTAGTNPVTRLHLSATRATIARRLLESKQTIPHYRLSTDVEVDRLQQYRRHLQSQARISLNDLLLRACALASVRHPVLNAQFDGTEILQFAHADIAMAVATDNGLITPIIRNADLKPLPDIARETADLAERARRSALTREEITGGTFTVSNLGMYGLASFDAIINPPQVAILAVGAAREAIIARDAVATVARLMTLTLSADHRVVDGAQGAAFLATLKDLLQSPDRL
jgi:pyruvate dehydrogenase E2 component (dihydrolipoamide acetyltransferase)